MNGTMDTLVCARDSHREWRIASCLFIVHSTMSSCTAPGTTTHAKRLGHDDVGVRLSYAGLRAACGDEASRRESEWLRIVVDGSSDSSSGGLPREDLLSLLIPEGIDPTLDAAITAHGIGRISGPRATCIGSILLAFSDYLPYATREDFPPLAEALQAILLVALNSNSADDETADASRNAHLRTKVNRVIDENIGSARLDAARVAQLAGVSRATLYRLFDGCGGVAAHIRRLRLERMRTDLCDPAQRSVPIALLAERNGLHNVASFNRSFRRAYGATPRQIRTGWAAPQQ